MKFNRWYFITVTFALTILHFGFLGATEKDEAANYFENMTASSRREVIASMRVVSKEGPNHNSHLDIIDELNNSCKGIARYSRDTNGRILWPTVQCHYLSEKSFDGMTPKFKCQFTAESGKTIKAKVKYASTVAKSAKELSPAILVSGLSRLMGYATDTYCPAVVVCAGCAADPWKDMQRSSAPALVGTENSFANAIIEVKVEGLKVSEPRNGAPKPLGLKWEELAFIRSELSTDLKLQELAQRESLMLWMNFIYHGDADAHNNRLVCQDWSDLGGRAFRCDESVGYAHDYGDAFFKMNFWSYKTVPVFLSSAIGHPSLWFKKCVGSLVGGEGAIRRAVYSEEARLDFLSRFDTVTWTQLLDLLDLARVGELSEHSSEQWAEVFRDKIQEIRNEKCDSLTSGETVLSSGLSQ